MNLELLKENIETFHCEIDSAYSVISCIRTSAENNTNDDFKCFAAELYGIDYYLKLLTDFLQKEASNFSGSIDKSSLFSFYKNLKRVHELFLAYVLDYPFDQNTIFLHKKSITATYAAFYIVDKVKDSFSNIMGVNDD